MRDSITQYNGKYVYIPGACPDCGAEDTMRMTHIGADGVVDITTWYFQCLECRGMRHYDWWVVWSFTKDIEEERLINKA